MSNVECVGVQYYCSYVLVSLFLDIGVGLVLPMVHSSPAIKQVYNCEANDVGPV